VIELRNVNFSWSTS